MLILPQHEQHYPDKLLSHRLEEYVLDGAAPTQNRAYAKRISTQEVMDAVAFAQKTTGLSNIDLRYYVGTFYHEAGCTNEWDTEVATASCPPGFVSVGAFQIGEEEANRYGFQLADMLDFDKACQCFVRLAEDNRKAVRAAAGLTGNAPDPDYTDPSGYVWVGGGMRAYLAITHNHGVGYMRATVKNYGLDWAAYQRRNPTDNIVAHKYGPDCVTGGDYYPGNGAPVQPLGHRLLELTNPFMFGPDVKELQLHLKVSPADGVYGPATAQVVSNYQMSHGLLADGKCGPATWQSVLAV